MFRSQENFASRRKIVHSDLSLQKTSNGEKQNGQKNLQQNKLDMSLVLSFWIASAQICSFLTPQSQLDLHRGPGAGGSLPRVPPLRPARFPSRRGADTLESSGCGGLCEFALHDNERDTAEFCLNWALTNGSEKLNAPELQF